VTIVDAHHHIWRLAQTPWLNGPAVPRIFGEYGALRRDYLIEEYLDDIRNSEVTASIFVQVNVAPDAEVAEVDWVHSVAQRHGFPQAITAYADLASADIGDVLDRETASGRVRAIRQQLHWHHHPAYRFAFRPDLPDDPAWRRGLGQVEARALAFELQVFPGQMACALRLVNDFPGVTFILLHAGMLEDRSESGWSHWRAQMKSLAACPNVVVKLSGLGTFLRACSEEAWRPVIEQTVDMFGPARCMFGSNFPIEKLWTDYTTLTTVFRRCLSGFAGDERSAILQGTARRIYSINGA
jgi:predicted TIM-barrel fold metal-dependent hydrolase